MLKKNAPNGVWGMKDPRMCLLADHYVSVKNPVCVLLYRNPLDSITTMAKMCNSPTQHQVTVINWLDLVEEYMKIPARACKCLPTVFVSHTHLITKPYDTLRQLYYDLVKIGVTGLSMPAQKDIFKYLKGGLATNGWYLPSEFRLISPDLGNLIWAYNKNDLNLISNYTLRSSSWREGILALKKQYALAIPFHHNDEKSFISIMTAVESVKNFHLDVDVFIFLFAQIEARYIDIFKQRKYFIVQMQTGKNRTEGVSLDVIFPNVRLSEYDAVLGIDPEVHIIVDMIRQGVNRVMKRIRTTYQSFCNRLVILKEYGVDHTSRSYPFLYFPQRNLSTNVSQDILEVILIERKFSVFHFCNSQFNKSESTSNLTFDFEIVGSDLSLNKTISIYHFNKVDCPPPIHLMSNKLACHCDILPYMYWTRMQDRFIEHT